MKIPASPLLLGLALSSSTLAYPTPKDRSPNPNRGSNPESSPLLSTPNTPVVGSDSASVDDAWGDLPPRISRRWGKRQMANTQSVPGASGLLGSATGLLGSLTGGTTVQGLTGAVGGLVQNPTGLLGGSSSSAASGGGTGPAGGGLGSALGVVGGVTGGLPLVGGVVSNVGGNLNGLPLVGGLLGGVGAGAAGGSGGVAGGGTQGIGGTLGGLPLVGGLVGGLGGTVNGLPVVGGVIGGLTGGALELGTDPLNTAQATGGSLGNAPRGGSGQVVNAMTGNTQNVGGNTAPGILANLGDGRYLLSNGQILSLGDLNNLGGLDHLGSLDGLTGVANLGQASGAINGVNGLPGNVGGLTGSGLLGGLTGGMVSQVGASVNGVDLGNGLSGLTGTVQSGLTLNGITGQLPPVQSIGAVPGVTGLSGLPGLSGVTGVSGLTEGRLVNIGGHLITLDQAQALLRQHGLDGLLGQFATDPNAGEAYDEGSSDPSSTTSSSTTPSSNGSDAAADGDPNADHVTPAQAFQASDPFSAGNDTYARNSTAPEQSNNASTSASASGAEGNPPTNTFLSGTGMSGIQGGWEDEDPWSDADIENDGRFARLQPPDGSALGTGTESANGSGSGGTNEWVGYGSSFSDQPARTGASGGGKGGYANPFPEYQYGKDEGALDLVAGIMGAPRPSTTDSSSIAPSLAATPSSSLAGSMTSSSSTPTNPTTLPSGYAVLNGGVTGFDFVGKPRQGWDIGKGYSYGTGYSRPPSASSSVSASASSARTAAPSETETPSAPIASAAPDEDDQWGDWVSAEPSPSPAPTRR